MTAGVLGWLQLPGCTNPALAAPPVLCCPDKAKERHRGSAGTKGRAARAAPEGSRVQLRERSNALTVSRAAGGGCTGLDGLTSTALLLL